MRIRGHLKILGIVSLAWVGFWLLGLPQYYRQYSFSFMLLFDLVLLLLLSYLLLYILKRTPRRYRTSKAWWLAFYISVPLLIYDYLYCAIHLDFGWSFFYEFWYLTAYYILPWLLCPLVLIWVNRNETAH